MSSRYSIAATVLVLAIVGFWLVSSPVTGQVPIPPDFSYEETKPLDPVPFSHKFHVSEKKLQCPECHIKPKIFEMKKLVASPKMKMANLNEGEFCGTCHNGKRSFATKDAKNCARCHVKKS
jgi:c(7)-type cytochrome triheme protein